MVKPKRFVRFYILIVAILAVCVFLVTGCVAQANSRPHSRQEVSLKKFLQNHEGNQTSAYERTTRYSAAFVDLRDDGRREVIVYLIDRSRCGSGGCSTLILLPVGSSYKVITRTTVTQLPIRILSTKTNGWHDLGVWVQGGGIQPGYEARLAFNGKKYPSNPSVPRNPSVPPAQPVRKKVEGRVLIPVKAEGLPLYGD
jgi:hypothetical protein